MVCGTSADDVVSAVSDHRNPMAKSATPNDLFAGSRSAYRPTAIGPPTISNCSSPRPKAASLEVLAAAIATDAAHTTAPTSATRASSASGAGRARASITSCA